MNILMLVFSKLFFVLYNTNVALFNHERQLIIVKLLKGIGKILPMQILQIIVDADSFKKCHYLPMPIPSKSADTCRCRLIGSSLLSTSAINAVHCQLYVPEPLSF